jgi:glycosyltransferase involved in cell wall biosynthesis
MTSASPASSEHIVASIADRAAGPSYSVRALTSAMARRGANVGLHSVAGWRDDGVAQTCAKVRHTAHRRDFARLPGLGGACLSGDLDRGLRAAARVSDILHDHGLWLMANIYPAWAAREGGAKLVISPRGMLGAEALAFSRLKKRAFWRLFQVGALREAACIHATSEAECDDVRAAGLRGPVAVIPNGVELPPSAEPRPSEGPRTVLSLGRVHPKKGLDTLVEAWARAAAGRPDWRLRIVGPAELSHDRELAALAASLGLANVSIEAPLFGADKLAAYRAADLFVLPTRGENFAMTVAESLAAGTPVISSKGAPWSGLEREACGWWVDHGAEPLAARLGSALDLTREELSAMGDRGRNWMARDFAWDRIAGDMLSVYHWLIHGGERPPTIRLA